MIDLTLKKLLSEETPAFNGQIGLPDLFISKPVEIFEETELRVDILCTDKHDGKKYFHAELQRNNTNHMLIRMMRYKSGIANRLQKEKIFRATYEKPFPEIRQICLYVGSEKMRIPNIDKSPGNMFSYVVVDARSLNVEVQLSSRSINDVVLAVLCSGSTEAATVGRILDRVAKLDLAERSESFARLIVLAEVRGVGALVKKRKTEMGFSVDMTNVSFFQDEYLRRENEARRLGQIDLAKLALSESFESKDIPNNIDSILQDYDEAQLLYVIRSSRTEPNVTAALPPSKSHGI